MTIQQLGLEDQLLLKSQQYFISPLNIIKELVENSIDSKCENITITIKEDMIKVQDDGIGISYDDMKNIGYYRTSKYSKNESYGYRGQALAAIDKLCSLKIISGQNNIAYEKIGENIKEVISPDGTIVLVTDLFKNCPIRKKSVGKKSITDLLYKYTIISSVRFSLSMNGKLVYTSSKFTAQHSLQLKDENLSINFFNKKNTEESLLFINKRPISLKVKYINQILKYYNNIYYSSGSVYFHLFLNIKSYEIFAADKSRAYFDEKIIESISKLLSENYQKCSLEKYKSDKEENSVVFSAIDEDDYFVNDLFKSTKRTRMGDKTNLITPSKKDIPCTNIPYKKNIYSIGSFDKNELDSISEKSINQIEKINLPEENTAINFNLPEENTTKNIFSLPEKNTAINFNLFEENTTKNNFNLPEENTTKNIFNLPEENTAINFNLPEENTAIKFNLPRENTTKNNFSLPEENTTRINFKDLTLPRTIFSDLKIIGQFNLGFILCKYKNYLLAIDQHSANECYNYFQLNKKILDKQQRLLKPIKIDSTYSTHSVENLINHNFKIENGEIVAVPYLGSTVFSKKEIYEILENGYSSSIKNIVASKACRMSIMIGKSLNMTEMEEVVRQLIEVDIPWRCPHGRPVLNIIREY